MARVNERSRAERPLWLLKRSWPTSVATSCYFPRTVLRLGFISCFHLSQLDFFVRPRTRAAIAAQSSRPCVCTAPFSLLSSSAVLSRTPIRLVNAGIQDIVPSGRTLHFRSTRNQRGNCCPILATMRLYCTLQLAVFICCPLTRTSIRLVDAGIQDLCHLLQHCIFVRPGTSAAIAAQFLPPCVCTAAFSLRSSSSVHAPIHPFAWSMLGSKALCHLSLH
jgi:hypothetical protein